MDRPPQLHERLGVLGDLEPDPQRLGLEGVATEDDVGRIRRRAEERVSVDHEIECRQRIAAAGAVGLGHHEVRAEIDERAGAAVERGRVDVGAGDELKPRRTEWPLVEPIAFARCSGASQRRTRRSGWPAPA